MAFPLDRASSFMASHARVLDRRRFDVIATDDDAARHAIIDALDAYRNPDGGLPFALPVDDRAGTAPLWLDDAPFAYVLSFGLQLLDVATDTHPEAVGLLEQLGRFVPRDGALAVAGTDGETLHLLDYAPEPDRPIRDLLDPAAVAADLDRLEQGQRDDGGWAVDYPSYSEAARLEWRGAVTVGAVTILRQNGR